MEKDLAQVYQGKWCGHPLSEEAIKYGRIDYETLAHAVGDCVLNNYIFEKLGAENWTPLNGENYYEDEDGDVHYSDVFQYYIITSSGADLLQRFSDELVYYNEDTDMYLWLITHYGTSWSGVLSSVKFIETA